MTELKNNLDLSSSLSLASLSDNAEIAFITSCFSAESAKGPNRIFSNREVGSIASCVVAQKQNFLRQLKSKQQA
jgi:hypothetical protein